MNNILRKVQPSKYGILLQAPTKSYPQIKFDVDLGDPVNWTEAPPQTTAKSWSLYDCNKQIMMMSKNLN